MMSLVLQHLENLQLDLASIDPANDIDAVDQIARMACELKRIVTDASQADCPPLDICRTAA